MTVKPTKPPILYHYHTLGRMQFGWRGPGEPHAQQKHITLNGISCNDGDTSNNSDTKLLTASHS
jgi:hypothetical protein